jgi:hypothetical protein
MNARNSTRGRIKSTPKPQELCRARATVVRWIAWFIPMIALLAGVLWLRLDYRFVAVCLLSFPIITIRLVAAWGDYQQLRDAADAEVEINNAKPAVGV